MAGSLIKINEQVASSTPSVLTVTGIDTTYNVYLVQVKGIIPSSDDTIAWRITKGGSIQTDSEYDNARKDMPTTASFQDNEAQENFLLLLLKQLLLLLLLSCLVEMGDLCIQ